MAAATQSSLRSPGRLGGGMMSPRVMLVPAGVSLPPGVHPVGLVARVASTGLGLEDIGFFATTRAAAGGGLRLACAALSSLDVLSSNGLGFASTAGLGSSTASRTSLLVAVGSEAEGRDDNDSAYAKRDLYQEMKQVVLLSWEWDYTDDNRSYQLLGFFGDGDVEAFKESADKCRLLMRVLLERDLDYTNSDMWVLSYAGQCLRCVSVQADRGIVYDGAVIEASQAVQLVCKWLLPGVPMPSA